jgi:Zn-dependent protease/DNA-directed RNA polymerase subunit RPC12/RpoP
MMPKRQGSLRLFRLFGIDVYLHWSWFLVALYQVYDPTHQYTAALWNWLEYLTLFLIVLMHEFGHALACRQVGGQANQIVLWPLGGVAYVSPPQRPGAQLWSIAAGPLVNALLAIPLTALWLYARSAGWHHAHGALADVYRFILTIEFVNIVLFVFNMMPVYPLDGGQLLRSLLWFPLGRARSLTIAAAVGLVGVAALGVYAFLARSYWLGIMDGFILMNCWRGLVHARALSRVAAALRRDGFACPGCGTPPPVGAFWRCAKCGKEFDTFETRSVCPHCGAAYAATGCPECGALRPMSDWERAGAAAPPRLL